LAASPSDADIKYGHLTSGGDHFVVHWYNVPRYGDNSKRYTLQVVLYVDGTIRFRYDAGSSTDGSSATVGVQEDDDHYDQHSYNDVSDLDETRDILYTPTSPPTDDDYSDWHFDELNWNGTSGEVKDSHWSNHGTGHSVVSVEGKICNAMDLRQDGTNDYAELGESALDGATDFTISVWHKGVSGDDNNALLSGANNSQDNEILYWFNNNTTFNGHLRNDQESVTTNSIDDGTWHHLVWRMKNKESCFYFDGSKQGCKTYSQSYTLSIESLILGQDQDNVGGGFAANQDWEGILDELLVFRKALTDSQISSIYNNQNAGKNWDGTTRVCPYPTISKTSCVIKDPVLGTTKPKRIPGATIRYAIEVKNPNSSTINNVIVTDNVTSYFESDTIKFLQIKNGNCDCTGVTSNSDNGSNGTGVGENPVKLDYGNISGSATECGYFEVDIK
jgi:hypothetical protein